MAILCTNQTRVLIQGITGNAGRLACEQMLASDTVVAAGVTPGKGGQLVQGVPVYNTIHEALVSHPELNTSLIVVPPLAAKAAALEAFAAGIQLVVCLTENIPMHDTAAMIAKARASRCRLVGPASIGIASPGFGRIGPIGGPQEQYEKLYVKGSIGVISTSGGMTNETAWVVRQAGFGQSTVVGIGGEAIIGTTFADVLALFEADENTKAVVLFGEIGGSYEKEIAELIKAKAFTKPLIAFIAGAFAEQLPRNIQFGHAAAVISHNTGAQSAKVKILEDAGVHVVRHHHDIGKRLHEVLHI